jgi:hypothetical protein
MNADLSDKIAHKNEKKVTENHNTNGVVWTQWNKCIQQQLFDRIFMEIIVHLFRIMYTFVFELNLTCVHF